MKALVLEAYNRLRYMDVPDPVPGPSEVLVRVAACGICGSDVHGVDGSTGRRRPPVIMGHEAASTVAAVGDDVSDWHTGDRVTFDSTIWCGRCDFCRQGRVNLCEDRRVLGVSCEEYRCDGAMAEYVVVPQRILYRLPEGLSFEAAAMVEPLSVAVHAVKRIRPHLGETAVVVGAGVIGLLAVQALRAAGCPRVLAVDLDASRLRMAERLGAEVGLNAGEDGVQERIREWSDGGVDVAVEAVGLSPTVNLAVSVVRKGGALALVGNVAPQVDWPLQAVVTRELSVYGSCASAGEYPACLDLLADGAVNAEPLISEMVPLSQGAEAFERLRRSEPGLIKVMLAP
ncbi:MAG TPA: galactitol-1-phosphate 5-dehydrogenase [Phycisphaerales bacterium]|nr:galactitol-1-phosphate 5-dehydrogenase [Phycisphaerales bacterium]